MLPTLNLTVNFLIKHRNEATSTPNEGFPKRNSKRINNGF